MFHHVEAQLEDVNVDIRMDEDGEARILGIEGTLSLNPIQFSFHGFIKAKCQQFSLNKKCVFRKSCI